MTPKTAGSPGGNNVEGAKSLWHSLCHVPSCMRAQPVVDERENSLQEAMQPEDQWKKNQVCTTIKLSYLLEVPTLQASFGSTPTTQSLVAPFPLSLSPRHLSRNNILEPEHCSATGSALGQAIDPGAVEAGAHEHLVSHPSRNNAAPARQPYSRENSLQEAMQPEDQWKKNQVCTATKLSYLLEAPTLRASFDSTSTGRSHVAPSNLSLSPHHLSRNNTPESEHCAATGRAFGQAIDPGAVEVGAHEHLLSHLSRNNAAPARQPYSRAPTSASLSLSMCTLLTLQQQNSNMNSAVIDRKLVQFSSKAVSTHEPDSSWPTLFGDALGDATDVRFSGGAHRIPFVRQVTNTLTSFSLALVSLGPLPFLTLADVANQLSGLTWLGAGADGQVYKTSWRGAPAAVKFICISQDASYKRAAQEAILSKAISHPHLVQTFFSGLVALENADFEPYVDFAEVSDEGDNSSTAPVMGQASSVTQVDRDSYLEDRLSTLDRNTCENVPEMSRRDTYLQLLALLKSLHAQPGSLLAIIVMEYCDKGSLESAIARGTFTVLPLVEDEHEEGTERSSAAKSGAISSVPGTARSSAQFNTSGNVSPVSSAPRSSGGTADSGLSPPEGTMAEDMPPIDISPFATKTHASCSSSAMNADQQLDALAAMLVSYRPDTESSSNEAFTLSPAQEPRASNVFGQSMVNMTNWSSSLIISHNSRGPGESPHLKILALLRTAREVAIGLQFLHLDGVVHGDLKPGNVLLRSSRSDRRGITAKISDFGMCRFTPQGMDPAAQDNTISMSQFAGTPCYMAPEVMEGKLMPASDVWSFGMLLYHMLVGQPPFLGLHHAQIVYGVQNGTAELEWPSYAPNKLIKLAKSCISHSPTARPTISHVVKVLASIERGLSQARKPPHLNISTPALMP